MEKILKIETLNSIFRINKSFIKPIKYIKSYALNKFKLPVEISFPFI